MCGLALRLAADRPKQVTALADRHVKSGWVTRHELLDAGASRHFEQARSEAVGSDRRMFSFTEP